MLILHFKAGPVDEGTAYSDADLSAQGVFGRQRGGHRAFLYAVYELGILFGGSALEPTLGRFRIGTLTQ